MIGRERTPDLDTTYVRVTNRLVQRPRTSKRARLPAILGK